MGIAMARGDCEQPRYLSLSLFSGAMGLDLGFEQSGRFETLAAIESDRACCETIRLNRDGGLLANPALKVYERDILKLDPAEVMADLGLEPGQLDVMIAGPPCQSFSTSGRRASVRDERGRLLWRVIDFLEVFRPKTFVIENVRGLVSAALEHRPIAQRPEKGGPPLSEDEQPGSVIRKFLSDLRRKLGETYHLDVFQVNAVNYGAPQLRERALFVGNRLGQIIDFPEPTHGPGGIPYATLGDCLRSLADEADPVIMDFSPRKKSFLSLVPPGGNWRCLPPELQKESMGAAFRAKGGRSGWWRRLSMDLPCPTVVTMPNHASTALCHPNEVRALTVAECAAVQEFPIKWRFSGSPQEQYRQVGNAVPTRLGAVAASVIAHCLDKGFSKDAPDEGGKFRLVYLRSHVRTRQWFKAGEVKVWADGEANEGSRYGGLVTGRREEVIVDA
jgi:DNA (cytosine-5)-methyltransferase 1